MEEVWKAIPGYEGRYEVSDKGRVRSITRAVLATRKNGAQYAFVAKSKVLAQGINRERGGYAYVVLSKNGHLENFSVSKLVALAFIGSRPEGLYILHGDGNPLNNCADNLRYGTQKENMADAIKHGTLMKGEQHIFAKLTEEAIKHIRETPKGKGSAELAKLYGVCATHISEIKAKRAWKSI